ncbi:uncharacterized protein LOC129581297 [Paramacrobiotus metropolitanus]|uniref:uncharacterized protein LOC129581297 n=1 Tax=Paramacrobiotus metropolitanus TaxID=2943436 RepID=UPI002446473F|nr:uncharacterized protein LOC129581297 [Paramacrobiotus metropolitanus]
MDPSGSGGFDLSANTTGENSGSVNITSIEIQCGLPVQVAYESSDNPTNWVEFVFYPILLLFCTVGNILNLLVLGTERNKTTTSVFLIWLALSDLCILWLYLPIYIIKVSPAAMDNPNDEEGYANFGGAQSWLSEACIQFSDWTLIAFSIERFIAVSNPLGRVYKYKMGRQICTTAIIELGLLILALAATVENAATWYYILVKGNDNSENSAWLHNWKNVQLQFETFVCCDRTGNWDYHSQTFCLNRLKPGDIHCHNEAVQGSENGAPWKR